MTSVISKRVPAVSSLAFSVAVLMGSCFAAKPASAQVTMALGSHLVFENGASGRSIEIQQPLSVRGGYRFAFGDLYLEYASFRVAQGSPAVQVAREHTEWLGWGRRVLYPHLKLAPYIALGAGVQYDTVATFLGAQNKKDKGTPHAVGAIAAGLSGLVREGLELQLESKLATSANYAPNPLIGLAIFVGWRFN